MPSDGTCDMCLNVTVALLCYRKHLPSTASDDQPLIDLSEDTVSLGADNKSLQPAHSDLSLFDSLCKGSNTSHYGNIELPRPLLTDRGSADPFDISPSFRLQPADTHSLHSSWPRTHSSGSRTDSAWGEGSDSGSRSDGSWPGSGVVNGHDRNSVGDCSGGFFSASHSNVSREQLHLSEHTTRTGAAYYSVPPVEEECVHDTQTTQQSTASSLTATARTQIKRELEHTLSAGVLPQGAPASSRLTDVRESDNVNVHLSQQYSSVSTSSAAGPDRPVQGVVSSDSQRSHSDPATNRNTPWAYSAPFGNPAPVPVLPKLPPPGSLKLNSTAASSNKPLDSKAEKAFDWLNDAISHLAQSRAGSGISPTMAESGGRPPAPKEVKSEVKVRTDSDVPSYPPPRYDEVPREGEDSEGEALPISQRTVGKVSPRASRPPLYDDVPTEADFQQAQRYGNISGLSSDFPPPQSSLQFQQYACASEFSDEFDDDEFDDDFYDAGFNQACDEPPPPLPPKDYQGEAGGDGGRGGPEKPYIFPVIQDGKQLSHTHYFLIPPKDRPTATATVRPFMVDSEPYCEDDEDGTSHADYQNITLAASHLAISPDSPGGSSRSRASHTSSPRRRHNTDELHRSGRSYSKSSSSMSSPSKSISTRSHGDSVSVSSYSDASSADLNQDTGHFGTVSPRERVAQVQNMVLGVTDEECHTALCHCHWDVHRAVRYLKVEQLFRLGVASRQHCETLLEALQWNLELASSVLLDEVRGKVQCESSV